MKPIIFSTLWVALSLFSTTCYAQNYAWAKGEGGLGNDAANSIAVDDAGNSYMTGNIAGMAEFSGTNYTGKGIYDVFIAKYNSSGDVLWVKTAGGDGNDQGNIIKYLNGYLYIAGSFDDTAFFESTALISKGDGDAFIAKYDNNGNLVWARSAGGSGSDYISSLDLDDQGNILVAGQYENAMVFDTTHLSTTNLFSESFIAKYDNGGNLLWAKSTKGTSTNLLTGIANGHNGNIYVTGFFGSNFKIDNQSLNSSTPSYDIVLAKLDQGGNALWMKRAGSIAEDAAEAVTADNNGNAIITGYFARTAYFDSNSVTYWDYNDVFVARYDGDGNNLWVHAGKGPRLDVGFAITTDNNNNIFLTGMFDSACDFDGHTVNSADNDRDIFMASYSPYGNIRWVAQAGGAQTDCGLGISIKQNGNVAICGYYLHTCSFGTIPIEYAVNNDLFIAEYSPPAVSGVGDLPGGVSSTLYPNPNAMGHDCELQINSAALSALRVFDVTGKAILSADFSARYRLPSSTWFPGVYIVEIKNGEGVQTLKMVKQ